MCLKCKPGYLLVEGKGTCEKNCDKGYYKGMVYVLVLKLIDCREPGVDGMTGNQTSNALIQRYRLRMRPLLLAPADGPS